MIGEKLLEKVVSLGVPLISKFVKDKDLAAKFEQEWRVLLSNNTHELEKLALEVERDMDAAFQKTVQAELQQNDAYTKRTRPNLARKSGYAAFAYIVFCLATQVTALNNIAIEWSILTILASPILTYMGVRSFDKWGKP